MFRGWSDYERGFGDLDGNIWLGLENIYRLTATETVELHIYMERFDGIWAYAAYRELSISDASDNYRLHVNGFSGSTGDSLGYHNRMQFSTHDRDNDITAINCAALYSGAWWYRNCRSSDLNGIYYNTETCYIGNIRWYSLARCASLKKVIMKIR